MRHLFSALFFACLLSGATLFSCRLAEQKHTPHILLITGGHEYEVEAFDRMLSELPVTYDKVAHPYAYPLLKDSEIAKYDAVLLYDMPKEIPEEAQNDFITMLRKGKGLVVLHHAFCSYDFWPEYTRIAGGRYHHYPWTKAGVEQPPSSFRHGVTFDVRVADPTHPVTQGIRDFRITDETYGGTEILPGVHPLLSTDEPTNGPLVAWSHTYENSRVVTFTLGHDSLSWTHPAFVSILSRSLCWVAESNRE
ncbi:MAG: ThuA domain-containing protein [Tannerellaceae bacterium]|jgi:type 1 glutamine amidotransferase|nr:ThuA domain-containing protein [Tannerellaceae bacterium]